ncbi:hypothetical protein C8Q74DRAFT_1369404 [Fomes fomentarius]|nr:hypothetical protein C8Q74DRAFT_1369404 [Fomes fomentarius]
MIQPGRPRGILVEVPQTHDLPCKDGTVHDHPHGTDMYESPGGTEGSASTEAVSLGKRGLEDHYDEIVRRSQRIREEPKMAPPPVQYPPVQRPPVQRPPVQRPPVQHARKKPST